MWKQIIALVFVVALAGCALPANVIVLIPDEGGSVGKVVVTKDGTPEELSGPYAAVGTGNGGRDRKVFVTDRPTVEAAFAGALAAKPRPPAVHVILFIVGQADIDPGSSDALTEAVADARATPFADIGVIGHSDATGDDAANLALSLRRATAIRDALVKGGVNPSVIEVGYHGSNNPQVPTPRGIPEPRNRRVEVTIR